VTALALEVRVPREEALHFLGYGARRGPGPRIEGLLGEMLEEARVRVEPRGVFRILAAEEAEPLGLEARPARPLALGLVTIGPALERRVSELVAQGEATRALILDAAGSAAAEEAADALECRIHDGPASRRFSPGYGSWPVTAQRSLFALLPHEEIGVSLLPSCLMTPRKSVSFALWLGGAEDDLPCGDDLPNRCEVCGLLTCPYRRTAAKPVPTEDS
jgi:hypothetical protein